MTIAFDPLDDERGIRVRDTVEGEQFSLLTDRAVDPTPTSTDEFTAPVDAAVAIAARELHAPEFFPPIFWRDGEVVHRADASDPAESLGPGTFEVDLSPPAAKLYVRVEDAVVTPRFADEHVALETPSETRFVVGVRSRHETPAGTVTTTDDPRDLMAAVSAAGSALKTCSPDRSWPTLRGHPPAVERGAELDVPAVVTPPETGVGIEVPPAYGAIYTVAPLAYYLGATVEPGDEAVLTAADSTYCFDASALAGDVRGVLEHVFALDCVVREAGVYPFRTVTADDLDERVALDYEALFESSLAERTAAYLEVPRAATDGLLDWHYTVDVAPDPKYAPALPYVLDELALVRSPPPEPEPASHSPTPDALDPAAVPDGQDAGPTSPRPDSAVAPAAAGTPGHSWIGDGCAVGAANPTVGSFRRAFDWPNGTGPLDVHVVYNDDRFGAGDRSVDDEHSARGTTVRTSRDLTTAALREAFSERTDFLHFVGRVTEAGMVCPDGTLDVRTLAGTGVSAFVLNGCRSYEQGRALLTVGSVGGIATVDDVADATAGRVGRTVATLLDAGFPLYAVVDVLERAGTPSNRYAVLGDGTFSVRRSESGSAIVFEVDTDRFDARADAIPVTVHHYPYGENGMGGLVSYLYTDTDPTAHSSLPRTTTLRRENLDAFLADSGIPVLFDGDLLLTDDLSAADFA